MLVNVSEAEPRKRVPLVYSPALLLSFVFSAKNTSKEGGEELEAR